MKFCLQQSGLVVFEPIKSSIILAPPNLKPLIDPVLAPESVTEKFVTSFVTLWMDDGILCCRYSDNLHVSLDVAKACVESRIFFAKGNSYPLLIDMKGIKSTTREAREYMASVGVTLVKAGALITGSPFNRMLGNIFLTIDRPPVPTRLFTNEVAARQWLSQYL